MQAYLDNSATTRPCEAAVQAVLQSMRAGYHNPSALYGGAVEAEREVQAARQVLATAAGADAQGVVFTSGGTESDNLAILGHLTTLRDGGDVLYTAAEHPAVKNACLAAAKQGFTPRELPLMRTGTLDMPALEAALGPATRLICVMQVCNETGVVMPLAAVAALRDRLAPGAAIHVDGVQGFLRLPFTLRASGVQSYAVSAHKIGGPKGVGALLTQKGHRLEPILFGGGQQQGLRSGTENTAGIAGLAAAVQAYPSAQEARARLLSLKMALYQALSAGIPELCVLGQPPAEADAAPHILYVALPPVRAETMVNALSALGVMVGTGSACSSRRHKRSEVLAAMGVPAALTDCSIRLSLSPENTAEEVAYAAEAILSQYRMLARFTRR